MAIERIVPKTKSWDTYYANHIARYKFADKILKDTQINILDAACGVGYGTAFLANNNSRQIQGIDISKEALDVALSEYSKANIKYHQGDCEKLTLTLSEFIGKIDSIVSFETFEHLKNPQHFLKEAKEMLSNKGTLILSTPNSSVTSPDGNLTWEFHEKEYTATEFKNIIISENFSKVEFYAQGYSDTGMLRNQFRKELNRINSNPFIRFGKFIQTIFKGIKFSVTLPEQESDFYIEPYLNTLEIEEKGIRGPFVLIAVCTK